jgi:molybdenum cofactor biosynthesis enzyme
MCKAADRDMIIAEIKLISKRGGKSGTFSRKE